jgi:hypothetical protein
VDLLCALQRQAGSGLTIPEALHESITAGIVQSRPDLQLETAL